MSCDRLVLLTPLRQALERIERKAAPLLNVICMQFLAAGEALKRLEKLEPGLLAARFPDIDWKGAMGFRDLIAHQYFDLDAEQVLLICQLVAVEGLAIGGQCVMPGKAAQTGETCNMQAEQMELGV